MQAGGAKVVQTAMIISDLNISKHKETMHIYIYMCVWHICTFK